MPIKVLIAIDNALVRRGFRELVLSDPETEIVGQAEDYPQLVRLAVETNPHVIVSDLNKLKRPQGRVPGLLSFFAPGKAPPILTISFALGVEAEHAAAEMGAVRLLDKMKLAADLVPAIRELAAKP
jgi:DNA-binding NarL/FixJ family response regulator